jgi:hypothetical protein
MLWRVFTLGLGRGVMKKYEKLKMEGNFLWEQQPVSHY